MIELIADNVVVNRGGRTILDRVSVRIEPGDFLSVVGPNGSGKSSLLRAMAGVWPLMSGEIRLGGKRLPEFRRSELARTIAFVPQDARMDYAFIPCGNSWSRRRVALGTHAGSMEIDRKPEQ
jgi:ABC-type cobalamin/Fe3+-siderophores transport system ATPase subunit